MRPGIEGSLDRSVNYKARDFVPFAIFDKLEFEQRLFLIDFQGKILGVSDSNSDLVNIHEYIVVFTI